MDSTPLLIESGSLPGPGVLQDHPIFLRASHSPWYCIPQNALVFFRGLILAYLIATGIMILNFELTDSDLPNDRLWFDFAIISFVMVLIYHFMTFCWTFTHLYFPYPEEVEGGLEWFIIGFMSLPRDLANLRKQLYFSLYYTTTVVFSFMNTIIYFFITRPHLFDNDAGENNGDGTSDEELLRARATNEPFSDIFGKGWFATFCILNLFLLVSVLMVIEIFFLNSIKRPFSAGAHIFSLLVFAGLFLGWAAIGHAATGVYSFFWLDKAQVGSQEAVTAYSIGFVGLAPICFVFMQGFIAIRESFTRPRIIVQAAPLDG
ncbi:hypothetical protein ACQKWADRAFT_115178 [Trichoderma austrokoningii]